MSSALIGILALQGAFAKHQQAVEALRGRTRFVKTADDLKGLSGLIIPGGESTVIGKLMKKNGLDTEIKAAVRSGLPVFGTCAGLILLAAEVDDSKHSHLGLLDVCVMRNGYGRQKDSFRADLLLGDKKIDGIFIRAPRILSTSADVAVLCSINKEAVMVRQDNILAAAFHPELSGESEVHRYFIEKIC